VTEYQSPVEQEAARGHRLLALGDDAYAEVSCFNGRVSASMRRWFKADDGKWYRTKNGLSLPIDAMLALLNRADEVTDFVSAEADNPWEDQ